MRTMLQHSHIESSPRSLVSPAGRGALANLNEMAKEWSRACSIGPEDSNPLIQAPVCAAFVEWTAEQLGVVWTWGGYLEDRSFLWRGSYLDAMKGGAVHAGIDINVDAGLPVTSPVNGTVLRVDDDTPDKHGWGPRVFIEPTGDLDVVLIIAHLDKVQVAKAEEISKGRQLGVVGAPPFNGNWFPHVHFQAVTREFFERQFPREFKELDGYFPAEDISHWRKIYPDPFGVVQMWRGARI
jgi:hypothetical protein